MQSRLLNLPVDPPRALNFYDAVAEKLAKRPDMQQNAAANDEGNFGLVLGDEFMKGVVDQLNTSEAVAIKFIDDKSLQQAVIEAYLPLV